MHHTTQTYLRALHAYRTISMFAPNLYELLGDAEKALLAWSNAGYPDADPEPRPEDPATLDGWTQEDGIWSHKSGSRAYLHRGRWVRVEAEVDYDARDSGCAPVLLPLDMLRTILRGADHPAATTPKPEAATAPSLEALAATTGALEVSPLAGGDLRAELEAARAERDLLAMRLSELAEAFAAVVRRG